MTQSTTRYRAGDVVLLPFPFTDQSRAKPRPAVVISSDSHHARQRDVVVIALTSQPQSESAFALQHWAMANLLKPTWVKPVVVSLASELIIRRLGSLSVTDRAAVRAAIRVMVSDEFLHEGTSR